VAELVLLPIYPAGERPIAGVTSERLAEAIRAEGGTRVHVVADLTEAAHQAAALLRPGDLFLTMGAGDVYRAGELAREEAA
jgi:UDP-N-acetylmuramate--alanine ligase